MMQSKTYNSVLLESLSHGLFPWEAFVYSHRAEHCGRYRLWVEAFDINEILVVVDTKNKISIIWTAISREHCSRYLSIHLYRDLHTTKQYINYTFTNIACMVI